MRIAGTEINLRHTALEVYLSGCRDHSCPGCHNPELWDFGVGDVVDEIILDRLATKLAELVKARLADKVWVLGGEPLDQDLTALARLLEMFRRHVSTVVLWTHYDFVPYIVAQYCDYAKLGPYVASGEAYTEPVFGIKLANKEQRIVRLN